MGAETEADQVGVVVDGDARVLADPADQGGHLQWSAYYKSSAKIWDDSFMGVGGKFYPILIF